MDFGIISFSFSTKWQDINSFLFNMILQMNKENIFVYYKQLEKQIGRASCRERVLRLRKRSWGEVTVKKTNISEED